MVKMKIQAISEANRHAALQVRKSIAALPVYMAVCPDGNRGGWEQPQPCYPNIYFAVDDFQDVFSSMVQPLPPSTPFLHAARLLSAARYCKSVCRGTRHEMKRSIPGYDTTTYLQAVPL